MKRIILILSLLFLLQAGYASAATKYARNVTANWNVDSTWSTTSGGSADSTVPTAADDVIFDSNSGNITITAAAVARSVNMTSGTGNYAGTLNHDAGVTLTIGDATAGAGNVALKFVASTYTIDNVTTSAIAFVSTSATAQDVDFASNSTGNVTYNATSNGSWKLTGTHNTGSTATVTLTKGTLDVNGQTCSWGIFDSSNSNTRAMTMGAASVTITGTSWNFAQASGLTFTANTSTTTFTGASAVLFNAGTAGTAKTFYGAVFSGSGTASINGGGTFTNLTRTGTAVKTDVFSLTSNITVTGTLTFAGNSTTNRILVGSNTIGTARTITNSGATMTWSNVDLRDIDLGTAYDASAITGLSGDCGGNTNITFTSAQTQYGVGMSGGASWSSASFWATSSGGSGGRVPLPQDDVVLDANSFAIP